MSGSAVRAIFKSPLHEMTQTTPTCLWNDSASIQELTYSLDHGAVGATCNPVIVLGVLKKEMPRGRTAFRASLPSAPEPPKRNRLANRSGNVHQECALLRPIFDAHTAGMAGSLSKRTRDLSRFRSNRRPGRGVQSHLPPT